MGDDRRPVLVIGATGFVGGHLVTALRRDGRRVRCLVRTPARAQGLVGDGVEVVVGDMVDGRAVAAATAGVSAILVCVHTVSPQPDARAGSGFMDIEAAGIRNVIAACRAHGVRRVLYVTSIGVAERGPSSWLRGRWATEQELLRSGLDVTVLRPGMIVGRGGDGFGLVTRAATRRIALAVGSPRVRFRTVAVADIAQDLVDLLDAPASFGRVFEAGSDDVLTMRQMAAIVASSLGRRPGRMLFVPAATVRATAPVLERIARLPKGAISGFVGDGPQGDMIGDPAELREVLGRSDRSFSDAIDGEVA